MHHQVLSNSGDSFRECQGQYNIVDSTVWFRVLQCRIQTPNSQEHKFSMGLTPACIWNVTRITGVWAWATAIQTFHEEKREQPLKSKGIWSLQWASKQFARCCYCFPSAVTSLISTYTSLRMHCIAEFLHHMEFHHSSMEKAMQHWKHAPLTKHIFASASCCRVISKTPEIAIATGGQMHWKSILAKFAQVPQVFQASTATTCPQDIQFKIGN